MEENAAKVQERLTASGYKSAIVSVKHLGILNSEVQDLMASGLLARTVYDETASSYDFRPSDTHPPAESIIITAARQPKVEIGFNLGGRPYRAIIPPTYFYDTDDKALDVISSVLNPVGYTAARAAVRAKALAAHSGLVKYGKNNVTYIDGWGSFFRLRAFLSNLPCPSDAWVEPRMLELCENCFACVKGCPTKAIDKKRFVIHAERCLTYLNERRAPFPDWVDPTWHNCLIGCLKCQDVCPVNKDFADWMVPGIEFSEHETRMFLNGTPRDKLPEEMIAKLRSIYMMDDYELLGRNLGALVAR